MIDVVVADDDAVARTSLSRLLSRAPDLRIVGEVCDGKAAVEMVQDLRPHVVVLDVHMPGMSGVEAATSLRSRADATPIVFFTADLEAAASGLALEGTTVLVKSVASLRETIETVRTAGTSVSRRRRRSRPSAPPA